MFIVTITYINYLFLIGSLATNVCTNIVKTLITIEITLSIYYRPIKMGNSWMKLINLRFIHSEFQRYLKCKYLLLHNMLKRNHMKKNNHTYTDQLICLVILETSWTIVIN